jgi:hypothetical protein
MIFKSLRRVGVDEGICFIHSYPNPNVVIVSKTRQPGNYLSVCQLQVLAFIGVYGVLWLFQQSKYELDSQSRG